MVGTIKPNVGLFTLCYKNQGHIIANMFIEVKGEVNQNIFTESLEGPPLPDCRFTVNTWSK